MDEIRQPSNQFQGADRADIYAKYRPKTPQQLVDKIIAYLKEKVRKNMYIYLR